MGTKTLIRKEILEKRAAMTKAQVVEKSRIIIDRLMGMDSYQAAQNILVYVDFKNEVNTRDFINKAIEQGKHIFCPAIRNQKMDFFKINGLEDLTPGYYGILEPVNQQDSFMKQCKNNTTTQDLEKTLMIMPGVAFDLHKNRIGYGKGYYDQYLGFKSDIYVVALCFELQIIEDAQAEAHDRRPDVLLTEDRCIL